ncbi:MAG: hemerythrin family protein [Desulfobulbaceae bacterium]|nr:hemerythrin family protein [Desulfobulbaceae bacterium]
MGEFVQWSDELSVGIEEIDSQHKVLIGIINKMHEAIHQRHGSEVVKEILNELAEYTRIHFAVEESLMRILNFPGYEDHHEQHDELIGHVVELQEKVNSGKTAIGFELMHFLKVWLTKHILKEDMLYSNFFLASGVQPKLKKRSWVKKLWSNIGG